MPQSRSRVARTRAEILDHAGRLFRLRGYAGTNIDDVMLAAGLTRGAFYAHFRSKDELFGEALRAGTGLRNRLIGADPLAVVKAYLDKAELVASAPTCNLAALPSDIARAGLPARLAYANLLYATIAGLAGPKPRKAAKPRKKVRRRASPVKKRSTSRPKASGARRSKPAAPSRGDRAAAAPAARSSAARR